MRLNERVEITHFDPHWNSEGYRKIQVAVDGRLAWPFDIHQSEYGEMSDEEFEAYVEKCGRRLIDHYGDARKVRIREDGQVVPIEEEAAPN